MRSAWVLFATVLSFESTGSAATLSDGQSAYSQNRIADAERIYAEVIADATAPVADKATAERERARIAWLIDGNAGQALGFLRAAETMGDKVCDTAALTARVLRESMRWREAVERGAALLATCPDPALQDQIRTHILGARLDLAASGAADRAALIEIASADARTFSPDADIEAARMRLEAALLAGDAPSALAAWKDYFWIDDGDAPQALRGARVTAIFTDGLKPDAPVEDRLKLADLLMRTGFAVQSRRFATAHRLVERASGQPAMRRLQAYWSAREKLESALLEANRHYARAGKTPAALKSGRVALDKADAAWRKSLLAALDEKGDADALFTRHYGIVGTARGETSGYPSIHRGHVIEDREMAILQHGKSARIHYIAVDNMIANGFESWLWDGGPMVGGWQANGVIVNVRPGYVKSPLRSYKQGQDSAERRELIGRQAKLGREDIAKLTARPVATLPGLSDRLQLQLVDRIMAVARTKAADDAGVRKAFLAEFSRANFNQSIEIHEGRHAIDESLGLTKTAEQAVIEYQAKLSELALANYPRMALRNMNLNLEGEGPHDRAGARIFDEFRKWIEGHPGQVMGYDPAIPALAQLDKLSDGQIREIAGSLDPLPNGRPTPLKLDN